MRAVGYCRISTEAQAEGLGLDVQRETIEAWAAEAGAELVEVFTDTTSGSNQLEYRTGLVGAIDAIRKGEAQALVVPRLDRLARDLVIQEQVLGEVWSLEASVVSCATGEGRIADDPDDPSRRLIRQVLGAVSEYERAMIVARMRRGRMAKAARGGFATGAPPFGWESDGEGGLIESLPEQQVIARMRELRGQGRSFHAIADQLNEEHMPTKWSDGRWHAATVRRVLNRDRIPGAKGATA